MSGEGLYRKFFEVRKKVQEISFIKNAESFNYKYLDYPELQKATCPLLQQEGLLLTVSFCERCIARVYDVDNPSDFIEFQAPIQWPKKKYENIAKRGEQPCRVELEADSKEVGAMMTYMRRYMCLLVLDIAPRDELDGKNENNSYNSTQEDIYTIQAIETAMRGWQNDAGVSAQQIFDYLQKAQWMVDFIGKTGQKVTFRIKTPEQLERQVRKILISGLH